IIRRCGSRRAVRRAAALAVVLAVTLALYRPASPQPEPLTAQDFVQIAPQGFGDRQNSGTWSMAWWKGNLYVGTVRSFYCWVQAWLFLNEPFLFSYPPLDPEKQ